MKKRILLVIILEILFLASYITIVSAKEKFTSLNPVIDMDDKIYVQHKEPDENGYIYDKYLLSSEGEKTTVYEVLNINYTVAKQWTRDGLYIDDTTYKVVATAPEDYIEVKEGEEFFVRLYGIGDLYRGVNGDEWHITSPIVFFNDDNVCVGYELSSEASKSKAGKFFTVPEGATRMYVSNYCNQTITVQRKVVMTAEEFSIVKAKQDKIINNLDTNYSQITNDPIIYKDLDKAYITFVNDDTVPDIGKFADLFISKKTPLCLATIADNLPNYASNLEETRLQVALRVQKAGGEILAHNGPVITADTINDKEFMYQYFVVQKQFLKRMGLNVNGIILAGGSGQIVGDARTAKWASSLYSYADLLGEKYDTPFGVDSVYYHPRGNLGNYGNDFEKMKEAIDSIIENKKWQVFYFHNTSEITLENLEKVIDYINSKGTDKIEVLTYEDMYKKFAVRESSEKSESKTYYVSANGTSSDGTDKNNPMNLSTLNIKKLKTGDTVLFKNGDTFFGTLNFEVYDTNNGVVTLSNYGEGELPAICTYKYLTGNWEKYSDNIYRIDISDTKNFTGYVNSSTLAFNVGFLEDDNGKKYYNKKVSIENLTNNFDFYSDGSEYLYMYLDDGNPKSKIGNVKAVVRSNLMMLKSNMDIKNIRFAYTGGHGLEGAETNLSNITIENCIIENIGGSYLYSTSLTNDTRYGNGIEFYGSDVSNITVKNNIIRNTYDVGFTIQGTAGSGTNVIVKDNVFVNNSQDSEIWENGTATGIHSYEFTNNISINAGRGWGYDARPDKYNAEHILFWGYSSTNTNIYFHDNAVYNPRRIYFMEQTNGTNLYFKNYDYIKSDYNRYYMTDVATIFRESYKIAEKDEFIAEYNKDINSIFNLIDVNEEFIKFASQSNNIEQIRSEFKQTVNEEDLFENIYSETGEEKTYEEETYEEEAYGEEYHHDEPEDKQSQIDEYVENIEKAIQKVIPVDSEENKQEENKQKDNGQEENKQEENEQEENKQEKNKQEEIKKETNDNNSDKTKAKGILPQTGVNNAANVISIIALIVISIVMYKKYKILF